MRRLGKVAGLVALFALLLWAGSELWQRELPLTEDQVFSEGPPATYEVPSEINLQIALNLSAIADLLNARVDQNFVGREENPTEWLVDDYIEWRVDRGRIVLSNGPNGSILFDCEITSGNVTVYGRPRVVGRDKGLPRWIDRVLGETLQQTASFKGHISGSFSPTISPDWTVNPQLQLRLDISKADAALFGRAMTIDLRQIAEVAVNRHIGSLTTELNASLQRDKTLKLAVQKAWTDLSSVRKLSNEPPIWFRITPLTIAMAQPESSNGQLLLALNATVLTDAQLSKSQPQANAPELPDLRNAVPQGSIFEILVPVSARLSDIKSLGNGREAITITGGLGSVSFDNFSLNGDDGVMLLAADMTARPARIGNPTKARVIFVGSPSIDLEKGELRLQGLQYTVKTRNALLQTVGWVTQPVVARELERRAVFQFAQGKSDLVTRANGSLRDAVQNLPQGVEVQMSLDTLDVPAFAIDEGWLVFFVKAKGRATVQIEATEALLAN